MYNAVSLLLLVNNKWIKAINAPSNSTPFSVLIVIGDNAFQNIISQMLVAINNDIPEPIPYPFYNISSKYNTRMHEMVNYKISNNAFHVPIYYIVPYIPDIT